MTEDRRLVEAVMERGDERAFRDLYRRHTPRLYQMVARFLGGDGGEAEDVVQETWVRACRGFGGFRWESQFGTWLTTIALNTARGHLQRRGRQGCELPDDPPAPPAPPAGLRFDLERAIARLPDGYRAVLVLHDVEGYTHEEIGRALDIAPGTSKSQLFQARRSLRAMLGAGEGSAHAAR